MKLLIFLSLSILLVSPNTQAKSKTLRVATFNVSMEATNYLASGAQARGNELFTHLQSGENLQIRNIAEIIQRLRPDIILLNEFDYSAEPKKSLLAFITNYLHVPQHQDTQAIDYAYYYSAPVNTGVDSGLDLDKDGIASGKGGDAFGFGLFPGHYGMALLSKYPIDVASIRTFQHFLWKDMPNGMLAQVKTHSGEPWYGEEAQNVFRLSSKSHWDLPILIDDKVVHVLASHPTPPVFDGPEDRNGKRNHDEVRFWLDYISGGEQGAYIYDDNKHSGGLAKTPFVIMGDLNSSPEEGDAYKAAITSLLEHALVNNSLQPSSVGGKQQRGDNPLAKFHTASWGMRADYVLPSVDLEIIDSGVFWPSFSEPLHRLVWDRKSSSDHRLVWVDINL